jgi:hypothetical protein
MYSYIYHSCFTYYEWKIPPEVYYIRYDMKTNLYYMVYRINKWIFLTQYFPYIKKKPLNLISEFKNSKFCLNIICTVERLWYFIAAFKKML